MDEVEAESVLSAILQGILLPDNSESDSRASIQVLLKVVTNAAASSDPKFRRLPSANEKVQQRIINTPGASEFLDAVGFLRESNGTGDFVLHDSERLAAASRALALALALLPESLSTSTPIVKPLITPSNSKPNEVASQEYEKRRAEAEARQSEIRRKMEEDRKKKEALRAQIKAEQREVRDRPIVASHAVHISRPEPGAGGGDGKIRYTNSDKEFQTVINTKPLVLVNFTASWCGPCQAIAPAVEEMARSKPSVTFIKIDIDENNETPSKFNVTAVPTFILFRNGTVLGEVKGANQQGIQALLAKV
jgi:thioredoxin